MTSPAGVFHGIHEMLFYHSVMQGHRNDIHIKPLFYHMIEAVLFDVAP